MKNLITHPIGSHVMQRLLRVCPANLHGQLYNDHFRHNIKRFCQHNIANFVVSSLIRGIKNETLFGMILDELVEVAELLMGETLSFFIFPSLIFSPSFFQVIFFLSNLNAQIHFFFFPERKAPSRANVIRQAVTASLKFPSHQKTVMKIVTSGLHVNTAIEKQNMFKSLVYLCKLEVIRFPSKLHKKKPN